jgi:AcrR family transcriptional regulator
MGERSTRERILDQALDLFVEKGFDNASLRELAERMGFTKAALYYHFPSKAQILVALHQRMHGLIDEPLALLGDGDGPVGSDAYEAFLIACLERMQANEKLFVLHRLNQAAITKVHSVGHEGSHQELEERARKIFSEPSLSIEQRLRMVAAFAVAFVTPVMATTLFPDGASQTTVLAEFLREVVHQVLHADLSARPVPKRPPGRAPAPARRPRARVPGAQ